MSRVAIAADVADVLSRATIEPRALILNDTGLDRALYVQIDKVLKALGGKWNGRERCHQFPEGATDKLKAALAGEGQIIDQKKALEQFFTPKWLAQRMAEEVNLTGFDHVLEPSAGMGVLLADPIRLGCYISAVEKDEMLAKGLVAMLGGIGRAVIQHADFMEWHQTSARPITVALMNPPFSKGQDVRHVVKAFGLLAPGGRMAAIMGEHAFFATDKLSCDFRDFLERIGATVEQLPAGTFKESGTSVDTRLIVATKAGQ